MPKTEKECKGWWICKACGHFFEFLEANEIEEVGDEIYPVCPECGEIVMKKQKSGPPIDYLSVSGEIHAIGNTECKICDKGYPTVCLCGGLQHKTGDTIKCDRCLKVEYNE